MPEPVPFAGAHLALGIGLLVVVSAEVQKPVDHVKRQLRVDGVAHLIARRLTDMSAWLGELDSRSRDFR